MKILYQDYFFFIINLKYVYSWMNLTKKRTPYFGYNLYVIIIFLIYSLQYYFSEYFTELLIQSKLKFHQLFQKTYGIIYERNSDVFIDFFKDLEHYYDHGEVDLEDALKSFFSHLYQRMFTVFNAQHNFDST